MPRFHGDLARRERAPQSASSQEQAGPGNCPLSPRRSTAGEGVPPAAKFTPSSKIPNTAAPQIEVRPEFIHRLIISPHPRAKLSSKYYTLVAQPFLLVFFS